MLIQHDPTIFIDGDFGYIEKKRERIIVWENEGADNKHKVYITSDRNKSNERVGHSKIDRPTTGHVGVNDS